MKYLIIAAALCFASCKKDKCYSCSTESYIKAGGVWIKDKNPANTCGENLESFKARLESNSNTKIIKCEEVK